MTPAMPPMPKTPDPLPPVQSPTGTKPKTKSQAPSFLGATDMPTSNQVGQKTLLGQ
jgi:hypothetical protein